jgi:NADPH:quinone reductase-like Zn-dependent oxidoreductase
MKALVYTNYGNPHDIFQITDREKPRPKENEVLVKVSATTVNRTDEGLTTARYFVSRFFTGLIKPRKQIPGTDFAGQIEEVGAQVTAFKNGDRIFGFNDQILSSHAEYLTIGEDQAIFQIPQGLSCAEAAACCEGAHYAYNFINKVRLRPGAKVLVNGATGAIGTAAVQLLKYYGTEITAVANTKNLALVKDLGADQVIDYTREDFTLTQEKYDFIFDAVGKSSFRKCKPLLKSQGIYISSELGRGGANIFLALFTPIMGGKKVIFPIPTDIKKSLHFIVKLMEAGKFKAVIDRTMPFSQIIEAYAYVQQGQKTGNVVINMESGS